MYTSEMINNEPAILKDGELIERGFNYLAEAQERADELNRKETGQASPITKEKHYANQV